jgi:hypothetical protein
MGMPMASAEWRNENDFEANGLAVLDLTSLGLTF